MWPASPMKTRRLPHASANWRARSTLTYTSFVLATTMLGNGRRRQRHVREAASLDRIVGMLDVARRDEKCAEHSLAAAVLRPLRDERASEAVRGEDGRRGAVGDRHLQIGDPLGAIGMLEIALLHALKRRMPRFPIRLPMLRAGVPKAGNGEDGNAHAQRRLHGRCSYIARTLARNASFGSGGVLPKSTS